MLKSVSDNLDHGHVGIGSVVGEVLIKVGKFST